MMDFSTYAIKMFFLQCKIIRQLEADNADAIREAEKRGWNAAVESIAEDLEQQNKLPIMAAKIRARKKP